VVYILCLEGVAYLMRIHSEDLMNIQHCLELPPEVDGFGRENNFNTIIDFYSPLSYFYIWLIFFFFFFPLRRP
jgi:hypothetical protein